MDMYVTVHDSSSLPPTMDTRRLLRMLDEIPGVTQALNFLKRQSMDHEYYSVMLQSYLDRARSWWKQED